MKFFIDTADVNEIKEAHALGLVDGVTTNPSLVAKAGRDFKQIIAEICEVVPGPVSAEVAATDYEGMLKEWAMGKKLGPEFLHITDDGGRPGSGFVPYDDEGNPARRTTLIKEGRLAGRLHSARTAAELGEEPTGNARSIGFEFEPIVRMTTTHFEPGNMTKEELFAGVKDGLFIDTIKHGSGMSTFTIAPSLAYFIKDGRLAGPAQISVISGSVFDTFGRIDAVSDEVELLSFVGGGCGKMEQHPLPVGFGGPYVRVREMSVL